jgi:hypothetical protein
MVRQPPPPRLALSTIGRLAAVMCIVFFSGVSERIIMGMPMKIGTGMISLLNKYPFILSKQSAMTWVLTPVVYRAH